MVRVVILGVFFCLQILQCLTQGKPRDLVPSKAQIEHINSDSRVYSQYGDNATLNCVITGNPLPAAKWVFNERIILNNTSPLHKNSEDKGYIINAVSIERGKSYNLSLTISKVDYHDLGDYNCVAANEGGTANHNITLTFGNLMSAIDGPQDISEQDPSVGEYFLEAVDLMNRTRWRYFLPEDTDIDQDGNLSDLEVQHKFNTYMGEVFKLIDHDKDNSITEEEFRSLKLDIPHLTKAVDIALENFPLKPFFLAADANGDGVYDENDFYIPEKQLRISFHQRDTKVDIDDYNHVVSVPVMGNLLGVNKIGHNEGTVICKSLGYDGLERVVEHEQIKDAYFYNVISFTCDGTETRLEDCLQLPDEYRGSEGMGVVCQGEETLNALRLVGGKDSSSGEIFLGKKGLTCNFDYYRKNNSQVICRELGFTGVVKMTKHSAFTDTYTYDNRFRSNQKFKCKGNEQRLADCPISSNQLGNRCYESSFHGVVCSTDDKPGIDEGLSELLNWPRTSSLWEDNGRFLFIADANEDGKLTLEELATKGKKLMTKILEFLDENQDGKISMEDLNLHLSVEPIQNLVSELFDVVTAGEEKIDLYNMKIAGQDMTNIWGNRFKELDNNSDGKLNVADIFPNLDEHNLRAKAMFLIPMFSQKLDKNQDGKIQREELKQFIDDMFNQLDMDKNGALTLEDAYILLRENGLNCLQVGALRSFIKVFLDTIDTETRNFFGYIFHQFDMDGNGQISPTELEQMHVPCDPHFDRSRVIDFNSNAKRPCEMMFDGFKIGALIRSFPDSIFSERHGRGGREEPRRETLVDKLTNRACEMLT